MNQEQTSAVQTPADTSLNMMVLMSTQRSRNGEVRFEKDFRNILHRFNGFRSGRIRAGTISTHVDYAGLSLNMREFYRALISGTSQTKRTRDASTQTERSVCDKKVMCDERDWTNTQTPDMSFE